jgi:hypothetical protein
VFALLIAAGTAGACGAGPAASPAPGPTARSDHLATTTDAAATAELARAVDALSTTGYRVTVTASHGRLVGSGVVRPGSFDVRRSEAVESSALVESARKIGKSVWLNFDFATLNAELRITANQWISASPARLKTGESSPFDLAGDDPFDLAGLLAGVTAVRSDGPRELSGVVDFTSSRGVSAPDADELSEAGDAASSTPFMASLDAQGRILSVTINADAYNPDLTRRVDLSDYGSVAAPVPPPASAVVPASATVYQLFNEG